MCDSKEKIMNNPEIVSHVLLFLDPLEEQDECRLVSKRWNEAYNIAQHFDQRQLELLYDSEVKQRTRA